MNSAMDKPNSSKNDVEICPSQAEEEARSCTAVAEAISIDASIERSVVRKLDFKYAVAIAITNRQSNVVQTTPRPLVDVLL